MKILKAYKNSSFTIQLKARFLFYMYLTVLFATITVLTYTLYANLNDPLLHNSVNQELLLYFIVALVVNFLGLYFLIRGYFTFSAHVLLLCSLCLVWLSIFTSKTNIVSRLDTVVFAVVLLSVMPIVITKRGFVFFIYAILNIAALGVFFYLFKSELNMPKSSVISYLSDNTLSIIAVSIISYQVYSINSQALQKAESDIVERQKADIALRESEELKEILIQAIPDIIIQTDLENNILYANKFLEKITGITPSDYSNPNRKARIHPDDLQLFSDEVKKIINSDKIHTGLMEYRFIDSWGNIHWFSGRVARLEIKGRIILQTVTRDVTEKKAIDLELQKYRNHLEDLVKERTEKLETVNEKLKHSNREVFAKNQTINDQNLELKASLENLKEAQVRLLQSEKMASLGILTAGVAHEINNPLNFIMGAYEGLKSHFEETASCPFHNHVDILLNSLKTGIDRTSKIVQGLNQFSRTNHANTEDCNIHNILDNCISMVNSQLKHRITIEKIYTNLKFLIKGNVGKLHQVFINILTNAIQAIENEGQIKIKTAFINQTGTIEITDNGQGFAPEHRNKVIVPFFTTKDPGKGTGLGLSIAYNIIQDHKGTIEFQSEKNKGTTVKITFPLN